MTSETAARDAVIPVAFADTAALSLASTFRSLPAVTVNGPLMDEWMLLATTLSMSTPPPLAPMSPMDTAAVTALALLIFAFNESANTCRLPATLIRFSAVPAINASTVLTIRLSTIEAAIASANPLGAITAATATPVAFALVTSLEDVALTSKLPLIRFSVLTSESWMEACTSVPSRLVISTPAPDKATPLAPALIATEPANASAATVSFEVACTSK